MFISFLTIDVFTSWKFALIRLIQKLKDFKKTCRPKDFGQIAITSVLWKTMESFIDSAYKQLELTKGYSRLLFIDLCAAFNSRKFIFVLQRLTNLNVEKRLLLWLSQSHPQRVYVGQECVQLLAAYKEVFFLPFSFLFSQMSLL